MLDAGFGAPTKCGCTVSRAAMVLERKLKDGGRWPLYFNVWPPATISLCYAAWSTVQPYSVTLFFLELGLRGACALVRSSKIRRACS
jgi:hypothetical protein